jgi:hypothetical protein
VNDLLFPQENLFDDEPEEETSGMQLEYNGEYRTTTDVISIYEAQGAEDRMDKIRAEFLKAVRGALIELKETEKAAKKYIRRQQETHAEG